MHTRTPVFRKDAGTADCSWKTILTLQSLSRSLKALRLLIIRALRLPHDFVRRYRIIEARISRSNQVNGALMESGLNTATPKLMVMRMVPLVAKVGLDEARRDSPYWIAPKGCPGRVQFFASVAREELLAAHATRRLVPFHGVRSPGEVPQFVVDSFKVIDVQHH